MLFTKASAFVLALATAIAEAGIDPASAAMTIVIAGLGAWRCLSSQRMLCAAAGSSRTGVAAAANDAGKINR